MLDRTWIVAGLVVLGAGLLLPDDSQAYPHRGRRAHSRYGYGYPSAHVGYAPGYYPSFGFGYGYYPFSVGFNFAGGPPDPRGVVRFEVHPEDTEIYVDGYYAGIVDDFGKLRLEPGAHDITLYLDGHRTFEETLYSTAGSTVRIHHEMEPLEPGEPVPPRPANPRSTPRSLPPSPPAPPPPASSPSSSTSSASSGSTTSDYGELVLRSQPVEPEVWIDGEQWHFSGGGETLSVHLPAGSYELQLKRGGYETFTTRVDVFPGETTALNVRLGPSSP
jgi:hypothetical protein